MVILIENVKGRTRSSTQIKKRFNIIAKEENHFKISVQVSRDFQ